MLETALVSFTTFFVTVGPIEAAVIFAALTRAASRHQRRLMAFKAAVIATTILLVFAFVGEILLEQLGVSLAALRVAGGIILLLIGMDMIFARASGGLSPTPTEAAEAGHKDDISVFPLATPLIAGPGTMSAAILLAANTEGDVLLFAVVIAALLVVMAITLALLLLATHLQELLGVTANMVITRVMGILLAALAVQSIIDGVVQSKLYPVGAGVVG